MTYKQHAKYIGSLTVSDANGNFDTGRDAQDIDTIMFFADATQIAACIAHLTSRIHELEIEYMAAGEKRKAELADRLKRLRALRPSSAAILIPEEVA